jgi:tryptophanyl-tRNA synthetase
MNFRSLTGIKPTGAPHIGNWLGAIQPALDLSKEGESLYFIADYHAMTTTPSAEALKEGTLSVAATWLALGLDPNEVVFYKQSDVPAIFELSWLLSCFTPKGFMNRAHGYKDKVSKNQEIGKSDSTLDDGINMGFYSYPVLMAADILLFDATVVPIGQDQKQHLEFARDFADRINRFYDTELLTLPEPRVTESVETVVGLDGRKMSKSYDNTIPIFLPEKKLKKLINKIVTNSQDPEEPKNPDDSYVYALHKLFLTKEEQEDVCGVYRAGGMGWGKAKSMLFESINERVKGFRAEYDRLVADPGYVSSILEEGAAKANEIAHINMHKIRQTIGV